MTPGRKGHFGGLFGISGGGGRAGGVVVDSSRFGKISLQRSVPVDDFDVSEINAEINEIKKQQ